MGLARDTILTFRALWHMAREFFITWFLPPPCLDDPDPESDSAAGDEAGLGWDGRRAPKGAAPREPGHGLIGHMLDWTGAGDGAPDPDREDEPVDGAGKVFECEPSSGEVDQPQQVKPWNPPAPATIPVVAAPEGAPARVARGGFLETPPPDRTPENAAGAPAP